MLVRITGPAKSAGLDPRRIKRRLAAMMRALAPCEPLELSVCLVDDQEMRRLNREFLGSDQTTDVLSFPLLEPGELSGIHASAGQPEPLGDIVINVDAARRQAEERGQTIAGEVELLAAHGLLHLFGHDHEEPGAAEEMAEAERALVGRSIIKDR
jgi:probable rRNA maturation factor